MSTVPRDEPDEALPERYRCWYCKKPITRGDRCPCGRGWLVEEGAVTVNPELTVASGVLPDQNAQGSTAEYCSNSTSGTHYLVIDMRGGALASVKRCSWCSWIDFDDLDEQIREQGRRLATEGWEREWSLGSEVSPEADV